MSTIIDNCEMLCYNMRIPVNKPQKKPVGKEKGEQDMAMTKCPNCKNEISEIVDICPYCGHSQKENTIQRVYPADDGSKQVKKTSTKQHIYQHAWFIILLMVLCFPVGVYLMWKEQKFSKITRIVLTAVLGFHFAFWAVLLIILALPCPHEWTKATCTAPRMCSICGATEGEPLPHTKGEWKVTKEATLVDTGTEELVCSVCGQVLDRRDTEKKSPQVNGKTFNFTDEELIEWIESISALEFVSVETTEKNTIYGIRNTKTDKSTGMMLLNHRDNDVDGEVCLIAMHEFDNNVGAIATVTYIGELVDSSFSSDDAFEKLYYDRTYTKAGMTATMLELHSDTNYAVLAPSAYFDYILR